MFSSLGELLSLLPRDGLLSLLILALIISVFINLYAMQSGRKRRFPTKGKPFERLVLKYLIEQRNHTHQEIELGRRTLDKPAMRLREAYLAIEAKCLERGASTEEYWHLLNAKLGKLLAIYQKNKPVSFLKFIEEKIAMIHRELELAPPSVSKDGVARGLDKLYRTCVVHEHDLKKIEHINDKLSTLFFKLRSANYKVTAGKVAAHEKHANEGHRLIARIDDSASKMMQHASDLRRASGDHHESLSKMQAYSSKMKGYAESLGGDYHGYREDVQRLNDQLRDSESESDVDAVDKKIIDLSDEIVAASEKEIERLKHILKEKKAIIRQLEEQLAETPRPIEATSTHAEDSPPSHFQSADLELLRKNLRESEQCIEMLENELELLKAQSKKYHQGTDDNQEHAMVLLQQSIAQANRELSESREAISRKDLIFDFLRESVGSSSTADVALCLYQCLQDLGCNSDLLVSTANKPLELNNKGKLSVSQKMLIDSIRIGEFNASERDKKIVYRYQNFGGVSRKDGGAVFSEAEKNSLSDLFLISDKVFTRIQLANAQSSRKNELGKLVNSYKYMVSEVDQAIDKVLKTAQSNAISNFSQVADIARRGGLNAQLIANIKSLEKEFIADLSAEARTKIKLRKSQLEILKKLEDLES